MGPERCVWSQEITRTVAICSENLSPLSQRVPTKAIANRAFGLQNDCSGGVGHVMPGMQEEAAERIDAGLRKALAG